MAVSEVQAPRLPTILHVDMDAFYASVEQLENPKLRNKPLIVGGDGARGVVASCSYEARFYGVRSAMPSSRAKRLCPHAIFVSGHFYLYEKYSHQMHEIFQAFTPLIEGISLDEAFLDVSGAVRLFGSPTEIAHQIRNQIFETMGLRASVGVATSKHLAKLASEAAKPRASKAGPVDAKGVVVVEDGDALDFLHSLPVRAIWGVGPASAAKLEKLGITEVRQLAHTPLDALIMAIGPAAANRLHELAWNRDDRPVVPRREAKSVGHEQTFPTNLHKRDEVHRAFARLCDGVASRLREAQVRGRTVTAKVRFGSFETITRSRSIDEATSNARVILDTVDEVTANVDFGQGVRLVGVSVSNLESSVGETQSMFDVEVDVDAGKLDDVVDAIREKFGNKAVASAQLVDRRGVNVLRPGERQWGPNQQDNSGRGWESKPLSYEFKREIMSCRNTGSR